MRTIVLFLLLWLLLSFQSCLAKDFLNGGQSITGTTSFLVSATQKFELGFFSPPGSTGESYYLGIWYHQSAQESGTGTKIVVWVANRDKPVVGSKNGVFQIANDGNLVVTNTSGGTYWSSELKVEGFSSKNMSVRLMDSGNLVLFQDDAIIWQSFQHPTDTFLPGMKMDRDMELTSWRHVNDPTNGNYTFRVAQSGNNPYTILNNQQLHWESGRNGGPRFERVAYLLSNFTLSTTYENKPPNPNMYQNTRLWLNSTGNLEFLTLDSFQGWSSLWTAPESFCDSYNSCGNFFSCNDDNILPCKCLPGFSQVSERVCARKSTTSSCGDGVTFLRLMMVKVGDPPDIHEAVTNESHCQKMCKDMCPRCQAYSYSDAPLDTRPRDAPYNCWIWAHDLNTLQERYLDDEYGRNLSVRVQLSDIEPTPRTCEPCGTNIVPYPLSTNPNCGDPLYSKFSCNSSLGQLSFFTTASKDISHTVIRMDVDSRKFTVLVSNPSCNGTSQDDETLQITSPFSRITDCVAKNIVEVSWQSPKEPICAEFADCEGWNHSSCKEKGVEKRCLCDTNYNWDASSLHCTSATNELSVVPGKEPKASGGNSKSKVSLILGITLGTSAVILACAAIFAYVCRRKINRKQDKESIQRNRGRFYDSERHVKDLIEVEGLNEKDNEGIEVPYFDFERILVATDNFSDANKLGRGGYGPVYKGELQDGEFIAVKRLSSVSSQGLQEFKNEVVLIAKLQHRNLVRLRGYCIKGDEKILLYEYMHNKSLDSFIFDPTRSVLLDWKMRFDIIFGIARGMFYLHQDSRLRVIHRDLKTSNILLDEEMQPKISDFGLARIVGGKETEANTERVVGTYGYMSPEYALDGVFSTKSDVFSFGVVLLEIISGKKNTGFYQSEEVPSLLGYAWRLWTKNKLVDIMDKSLGETCDGNQFIRCAHIGLLCVQDEPSDRPSMLNVVTFLDSETSTLPTPKEPTFFASRGLSSTTSSSKPEISMQFESNTQEGR